MTKQCIHQSKIITWNSTNKKPYVSGFDCSISKNVKSCNGECVNKVCFLSVELFK